MINRDSRPSFLVRSFQPSPTPRLRCIPKTLSSTEYLAPHKMTSIRHLFLFVLLASLRCGDSAKTLTRIPTGLFAVPVASASPWLTRFGLSLDPCRCGGWIRRWRRGVLLGGAVERVLRWPAALLEGHPSYPRAHAPPRFTWLHT